MVSLIANIVLSLLVIALGTLLYIRRRQARSDLPINDFEKLLGGLHEMIKSGRTEGKIQKIASQLSTILVEHLSSDRILFYRRQRHAMELNYVYGLKDLDRGEFRFRLTAPIQKDLVGGEILIRPENLKPMLPAILANLLTRERFNLVFPVYWMDNLFGVYFIRTGLPLDHPLVRMLLAFLNQNLSIAYHVRRLEMVKASLENRQDEDDQKPEVATPSGTAPETRIQQIEDPGYLIDIFSHRKRDELITSLFDKVKAGLQTDRLLYISPSTRSGEDGVQLAIGMKRDEIHVEGTEFTGLLEKLQKRRIYETTQLSDISSGTRLKDQLERAQISRLTTFSLEADRGGLLLWADKNTASSGAPRLLSRLESLAHRAMINAREYERMEEMSYTDSLTGLYNHRYFKKRLAEEAQRASRYRRRLGLMIFDIDDFKLYNDNFGHQLGDELLSKMATTLSRTLRSIDIVSRYGGDEFCIIMPEADRETCEVFMDRLRHALATTDFRNRHDGFSGRITISIGSAVFPDDAATPDRLVYCADMALLQSKAGGRNKSTVFSEALLKE